VPVKPLPKGVTAAPITPDPGVKVRQLGAPVGGTIGSGNGKILMVVAFIGVLALGCAVITVLPGMARHWRLLDQAELLLDDPDGRTSASPVGNVDNLRFGGIPPRGNGNGNGTAGLPRVSDETDEHPKPRTSVWK
jgi:hypothetical protein